MKNLSQIRFPTQFAQTISKYRARGFHIYFKFWAPQRALCFRRLNFVSKKTAENDYFLRARKFFMWLRTGSKQLAHFLQIRFPFMRVATRKKNVDRANPTFVVLVRFWSNYYDNFREERGALYFSRDLFKGSWVFHGQGIRNKVRRLETKLRAAIRSLDGWKVTYGGPGQTTSSVGFCLSSLFSHITLTRMITSGWTSQTDRERWAPRLIGFSSSGWMILDFFAWKPSGDKVRDGEHCCSIPNAPILWEGMSENKFASGTSRPLSVSGLRGEKKYFPPEILEKVDLTFPHYYAVVWSRHVRPGWMVRQHRAACSWHHIYSGPPKKY